jgi:hypothetical protein
VSVLRTIANVSSTAAVLGGFGGFAAQWAIFDKGNSSETAGPVFIPLLGEHGIYTNTLLGGAWYLGLTLFSVGTLTWAVAWLIERNRRRS